MKSKSVNYLLGQLPGKERVELLQHGELVDLVFAEVLCEAEVPYRYVYFPLTAFVSLMADVVAHPAMEMGLVGKEGMIGMTLILGVDEVPLRAVVQGSGTAYRIPVPDFLQALEGNSTLLHILNSYLYVTMAQLSQTVSCTRFHEVEARLARWLLMTHDRAPGNHFHLTHQYLANMLGVQRSAISIAAGILQNRKFIRYVRGEIDILDRKGLEGVSCECYAAVQEDYARQFSPS